MFPRGTDSIFKGVDFMHFLKGHMGGNTILLLSRQELGAEKDLLERVLRFCSPEVLGCHEAGILEKTSSPEALKIRIAARASRAYISACGGLTQVLGKALGTTDLGKAYGLDIPERGPFAVLLHTEGGPVRLRIERNEKRTVTWTDMSSFVSELLGSGIEPMDIRGIPLLRVGKFLVIRGEDLEEALPGADVTHLDHATRRTIEALQAEFLALRPQASKDVALYDYKGRDSSFLRVTFPHWLPENHIEPACGTGTVAVGMAVLHHASDSRFSDSEAATFSMESGGNPGLEGPDRTSLKLVLEKGQVREAAFSHSLVELTARGEIIEGGDKTS